MGLAEVVVGVDGTPAALEAVGWAAAEAVLRQVPLRIVHGAPHATRAAGRARAAAVLDRARTAARRREPRVVAHSVRCDESPVLALIRASRTAGLLVVGPPSGHPGDAMVPSSLPAVVAGAGCPVTVVRTGPGAAPRPDGAVVLGVEDVVRDAGAIEVAFADAQRHGGPLLVRHVVDVADLPRGTAALHDALAPWRERYPDTVLQVEVGPGDPATDLVGRSLRARLVVVGSRGRRAGAATVLGPTSRALLHAGGCPVTVVPCGGPPGAAGGGPRVGTADRRSVHRG